MSSLSISNQQLMKLCLKIFQFWFLSSHFLGIIKTVFGKCETSLCVLLVRSGFFYFFFKAYFMLPDRFCLVDPTIFSHRFRKVWIAFNPWWIISQFENCHLWLCWVDICVTIWKTEERYKCFTATSALVTQDVKRTTKCLPVVARRIFFYLDYLSKQS